MRKHYIDNIRWIAVLFLFPYHTARIFDAVQGFYIKGNTDAIATVFTLLCTPWFMPLLFAVAGISTKYALKKRSTKQYVKQRFLKLFVPLISGVILLIPMQTYYAERFHNGYVGSYIEQYILFFTKSTDLSGYSGGFTPGQLWFLFYLFVISLLSLPIIRLYQRYSKNNEAYTLPTYFIILFPIVLIFLSFYVLDIGGKSLGEYFALFLLGYFVLADDDIQIRLGQLRWPLIATGTLLTIAYAFLYNRVSVEPLYRACLICASWISILGIMGMGRHYLNFSNRITTYFSGASFPLYIFHQSWIVLLAYYVQQSTLSNALQYIFVLLGSFVLSIISYEICKRIRVTRVLFGIKR